MELNSLTRDEIEADLARLERQDALAEEMSFVERIDAIDFIQAHIVERIESQLAHNIEMQSLLELKARAESLTRRLESVNEQLYSRLRRDIASGSMDRAATRRWLDECSRRIKTESHSAIGYDALDVLVNSLLRNSLSPQETIDKEPEMISYQPTPVRIVLRLIEMAKISERDIFCDLGSGLGQVSILVNLLTGAWASGIEIEPSYCEYARQSAMALNLKHVEFTNIDARKADYSRGTVFYLYTPFKGKMLQTVLDRLREESDKRAFMLCTYGSCMLDVMGQSWLKQLEQDLSNELSVFQTK